MSDLSTYNRILDDLSSGCKWLVTSGYQNDNGLDDEYAIGEYENLFEAIGVAYHSLGQRAAQYYHDILSPIFELENDAGYIIQFEYENCNTFSKIFALDKNYAEKYKKGEQDD